VIWDIIRAAMWLTVIVIALGLYAGAFDIVRVM